MFFIQNLIIFGLIFFGLIFGLTIYLQVVLSKKENKWLGLILPILSFIYSLVMVFNVVVIEAMNKVQLFLIHGETFLVANIPTIIYLSIYAVMRKKRKANSEIDKMNIKDL